MITPAFFLMLMHISTATPVGIEGPYNSTQCASMQQRRMLADNKDQSIMAAKGYQWLCMGGQQAQMLVKINHCMVGQTIKRKDGIVARTYDCIGK